MKRTAADVYFENNKAHDDHAGRSLRGGAVSVAARGVNAFVQIGSVLFLARLLSPEDYGLVAMVTALTGFAPILIDLGTRDAIVQRARVSRGEVSALFWTTIAIGTVFTTLTALCGPVIARFYGEPRLTAIVLASSFTFLACALSVQHYSLMRRHLMFQELAVIDVISNLLSAVVAVTAGLLGAGYWALIVRPIATPTFLAVGVWIRCRWLPGKPEFTDGVKDSVKFGVNITGFCLTDFASRSTDRVAIGYRTGASGLGQYQNAMFVYDNLLDVLVYPLHGVAVASLSKLRDDLGELRRAWGKALSLVAFFAMPAFGLLASTSQDVVVVLLGQKWASAGLLLSVLAFRGIPHCVERTMGWLHVTAGRSDRWVKWGLFAAAVQVVGVLCGLPFGPFGIAVAYVVTMFLLFVPAVAYAGRPLDIYAGDVVRIVWRPMLASVAAAAIAFATRWTMLPDMHPFWRGVVLGIVYLTAYLALVVGVLNERTPVRTTRTLVRGYFTARVAQLP